jgi:hypothetical protein
VRALSSKRVDLLLGVKSSVAAMTARLPRQGTFIETSRAEEENSQSALTRRRTRSPSADREHPRASRIVLGDPGLGTVVREGVGHGYPRMAPSDRSPLRRG